MDSPDENMYFSDMPQPPYFGATSIRSCGPGVQSPGWSWQTEQRKSWSGLLMWSVADGQGRIEQADGSELIVGRGDVLLMRWDRARQVSTNNDSSIEVPWCSFDWESSDDRERWSSEAPDLMLRHARDSELVIRCMQRVVDEHVLGHDEGAQIYLKAAIAEFAASPRYGKQQSDEWGHKIRAVCRAMQRNPEVEWALGDLAEQHHCDPDHFARMFKREVGEAPGRYAIRCRIDRARHLLLHTKDTVAAVG